MRRLFALFQNLRPEELISLARAAVEAQVSGKSPGVSSRQDFRNPSRGTFVTIERRGQVIGCRGTLTPRYRTLEEEVTESARSAAAFDPRYRPLTPADLKDFLVTVTVVSELRPIERGEIRRLTPEEGLVLRTTGGKSGVVLPYEGKDPDVRLRWAYKKAGIAEGSACNLQRMIAERYRG